MNLRKSFTPADLTLSEEGSVVVAFSRLNVIDHDGDVTLPGAIPTKEVAMSDYGHTVWDGTHPVGRGTVKEDGDLGVFDGSFFMGTEQGRNAYNTVKAMADLQEWSYGYRILSPSGPGTWEGQKVQLLKALDIFEVSPVFMGAGIETQTLAIKNGAPGPDAPWAEALSWYWDGLPAFLERAKDRREFRAAEGRKLSRTDRARLQDIEAALPGLLDIVHGLLGDTEADPPKADHGRTSLMVEIERARSLGVPIGR